MRTPPLPPGDEVPRHRKAGPTPKGCPRGKGAPCDLGPIEEKVWWRSGAYLERRCRRCQKPLRHWLRFEWDYSTSPPTRIEFLGPGYRPETWPEMDGWR